MLINSLLTTLSNTFSESEKRFLLQYIEKEKSAIPLDETIQRLNQGEPIDYILGYTYFYGLKIDVNQHTLIPRPETEELVDLIINENQSSPNLKILDIGTGSGCIALALALKLRYADVTAIDISDDALILARENAAKHKLNIEFKRIDILNSSTWDNLSTYDIIVSNPPYVSIDEKIKLAHSVLQYEPHLALFVNKENPLIFYDKILEFSERHLADNGTVYFETHQDYQLKSHPNFSIEKIKDLSRNWRFLKCKKIS